MKVLNAFSTVMVFEMQKAIRFYTEILGFKVTRRFNADYASIEAPGSTIELVSSKLRGRNPGNSESLSIGIQVDNIEGAMKELQTKGVVFTSDIIDEHAWLSLAFFTDFDKNPLYLVSRRPVIP